MDPAWCLISLRQGNCTLEAHIQKFLEFAHLSDLPDCALIDFFGHGLNEPLKDYLLTNGPRGSFVEFLDFALLTVGSTFTVGVVEKCDTTLDHVMAGAKDNTLKMAATTTATPVHVSADHPEQRHDCTDRPEQRHVSADRPEQRHVPADRPEHRHVSADRPVSRQVSGSVQGRRGLRSSVADPPLTSARAAGIPKPEPAASLSSSSVATLSSSSVATLASSPVAMDSCSPIATQSSSPVATHSSALDTMVKMAALPVPMGKMAAPAVPKDVGAFQPLGVSQCQGRILGSQNFQDATSSTSVEGLFQC
ncbi:hypothetical protein DPX16_22676 [Anabarilius grahami]|uniref:Uncharacterized protein n=1 Tax=Anabarilius grahami TaxID=495550 RepID=A0A3N0XGQ5_ANAGA|nr:hypothetical protein DPX16_22676 [Anabarilius grahami]